MPDYLLSIMGRIDMRQPCADHDHCYSQCGASKLDCDAKFGDDIRKQCSKLNVLLFLPCNAVATIYQTAVENLGGPAYRDAQSNCHGCKKPGPPRRPFPPGWAGYKRS
mgnify:CR=1 FL=1